MSRIVNTDHLKVLVAWVFATLLEPSVIASFQPKLNKESFFFFFQKKKKWQGLYLTLVLFSLLSSLLFSIESFLAFSTKETMADLMVGGALLSGFINVLFDRLASKEILDFFGGKKHIPKLLNELKTMLLLGYWACPKQFSSGRFNK